MSLIITTLSNRNTSKHYFILHILLQLINFNFGYLFKTTYENFRYRSDNRYNVYNRGCVNNFLEVFCTKIKPSRNNFRGPIQDVQRPPPATTARESAADNAAPEDRRAKVEDDLDIGGDLLKISQRHNIEGIESDIRSRANDEY